MTLPAVYVAGNPNSGKSTLFNALTGLHHKTANFPGITVESLQAEVRWAKATPFTLVDLPGTYSLYPQSEDERVAAKALVDASVDARENTLILLVLDASQIHRNMLLISQMMDLGLRMLVVLNKCDRVEHPPLHGVLRWFGETLGLKALACDARKGKGLTELRKAILQALGDKTPETVPVANAAWVASWRHVYEEVERVKGTPHGTVEKAEAEEVRRAHSVETVERYRKITKWLQSCPVQEARARPALPNTLDRVLLHPIWGMTAFFAIMALLFQALFAWATYPMEGIENMMLWAGQVLENGLKGAPLALTHFLVHGLMPGISGVLVFVPQIFLLFFFLALLEESGYMARVGYLMDRTLSRIGLNGKSIVPMLGGFACAVPSIAATRNIVSWKERMSTLLVLPLMSCSARLPVYALLVQFAVPEGLWMGVFSWKGLAMMGLYLLGVAAAVLTALLLQWSLKPRGPSYFMLEIPPYQRPAWRHLWRIPYRYCINFVFGAGKVIVLVSLLLWSLSNFGPSHSLLDTLQGKAPQPTLQESYAGVLGKSLEPLIKPLGFDWKIGIALVTSFAAREVFVGTMATVYGLEEESAPGDPDLSKRLADRMARDRVEGSGRPLFDKATVWSLLVFYAFALQCMSTVAATRHETGSWRWPLIQWLYMSALAYLSSFGVYQMLR